MTIFFSMKQNYFLISLTSFHARLLSSKNPLIWWILLRSKPKSVFLIILKALIKPCYQFEVFGRIFRKKVLT